MQTPPKPDIKAILREQLSRIVTRIRKSSLRARILAAIPFAAAILIAAAALLLEIFLRGGQAAGWGWRLAEGAALFAVFFVPLWFVGLWLYRLVRPRLRERRFLDATRVGLYLPHAIAVLVIVIARLGGSENIISLSAALITWAMLSLLLSPITVLLTLLVWTFLPSDEKLAELQGRTRELGAHAKHLLPTPLKGRGEGQKLLAAPSDRAAALGEKSDAVRT